MPYMWAEPEEAASYPPVGDAVEAVPTVVGKDGDIKSPSITTTEPEESLDTSTTSPETKTMEEQEKEEHAKDEEAKEEKPETPSHFKQTMSITQIFEKIKCFSGNNAMDVVASIAGTHAANKRKGALTEIQLTKRERRQKNAQQKTDHEKPEGWDAKETISAEQQCPPKKRGRKPKQNKTEKEEKKKGKGKASAKSKAAAKCKARASAKAAAKAKGGKKDSKSKNKAKATKSTKKPKDDSELGGDSETERKKRVSRKSAAYHRAFKMAKTEGHDMEQCKVLAKKVLYLNFMQVNSN